MEDRSITPEELAKALKSLRSIGGVYDYIAAAVEHQNTTTQPKETTMPNRAEILHTAIDLTCGDRDNTYGTPKTNHDRIAAIWSVILETEVNAQQVALCMAGVKIARLIQTPDHQDSYIDGAAYMAIAGELATD